MIITISKSEAMDTLVNDTNANWSYNEAEVLVDFFEGLEFQNSQDELLDVTEIRSQWGADCIEDIKQNYSECSGMNDSDALEWLLSNTVVLNPEDKQIVYFKDF